MKHHVELQEDSCAIIQPRDGSGLDAWKFSLLGVEKMLDARVIEPTQSEWASPIVIALKYDCSNRFCGDYRRRNAVTLRDR